MRKMTELLRELEDLGYTALDTQENFVNIREMREDLEQEEDLWETEMTIHTTEDPNLIELREGFDHWLAFKGQAINAGRLLNDLIAVGEDHGRYLDIGIAGHEIFRNQHGRYQVRVWAGDIDELLELLDTEVRFRITDRSRTVGRLTLEIR